MSISKCSKIFNGVSNSDCKTPLFGGVKGLILIDKSKLDKGNVVITDQVISDFPFTLTNTWATASAGYAVPADLSNMTTEDGDNLIATATATLVFRNCSQETIIQLSDIKSVIGGMYAIVLTNQNIAYLLGLNKDLLDTPALIAKLASETGTASVDPSSYTLTLTGYIDYPVFFNDALKLEIANLLS